MPPLRDYSIRQKLILVTVLIASAVLLLVCGVLFAFQAWSIKKGFTDELTVMAGIVANNLAVATQAQDAAHATQTLAGLKAMPQIVCACLDLPDGRRLAHFGVEIGRAHV